MSLATRLREPVAGKLHTLSDKNARAAADSQLNNQGRAADSQLNNQGRVPGWQGKCVPVAGVIGDGRGRIGAGAGAGAPAPQ